MKNLFFLFLALVLFSCDKQDSRDTRIIGTWELEKGRQFEENGEAVNNKFEKPEDEGIEWYLLFHEGGTYEIYSNFFNMGVESESSGTYTLNAYNSEVTLLDGTLENTESIQKLTGSKLILIEHNENGTESSKYEWHYKSSNWTP